MFYSIEINSIHSDALVINAESLQITLLALQLREINLSDRKLFTFVSDS